MEFAWKTEMRASEDRDGQSDQRLRGQAAVTADQEGRFTLHVLPDVGTFPADAVISLDDALELARLIVRTAKAHGVPLWPKGTPEYAAYAAELKAELAKWVAGEPPYGVAP